MNRYIIASVLGGLVSALIILMAQVLLFSYDSASIGAAFSAPEIFDEKLNSLNKRIDDLYVFAGVVVTLMLAINVSVYVRAANQIDDYIKENFENRKKVVDEIVNGFKTPPISLIMKRIQLRLNTNETYDRRCDEHSWS